VPLGASAAPRAGCATEDESGGRNASARPRIAAAIATHNHREALLRLLAHLRSRDIPAFVTANACQDGTVEAVRRAFPEVALLESQHNLGGTGGFNCAMLAALSSEARYVVLIDDDALPQADCLARLADFLDDHPDYVMAAPAIYLADRPDTLQETGGDVRFDREYAVEALNRFRTKPQLPEQMDVGYASACTLMVRSDSIRRAGVMDWDYFLFSDDVDWCLRLREEGRIACVTEAKSVHEFPWAKPFSPARLYYLHRNTLRLIARWQTEPASLRRALRRLLRDWLQAAAVGDREITRTLGCALLDAWHQRYGRWQAEVHFPLAPTPIDEATFRRRRIRRVLLQVGAEEQIPELTGLLRRLGGSKLRIDLFCDPTLAAALAERGHHGTVLTRDLRRRALLGQLLAVRRGRYDLIVTQAGMEPRSGLDMVGRASMVHHAGELWQAPRRLFIGLLATLAAPPLATLLAQLCYRRFARTPPEGTPPSGVRRLLEETGGIPDWLAPVP
jgi:GT2 family glycosyltransferase